MKYEQYASLITRLEGLSASNPKGYELRVRALGALGFAYFGALFFVLIVVPILFVALLIAKPSMILILVKLGGKLILIVAAAVFGYLYIFWDLVGAFWRKAPPPDGIEIRREDAPRLFEKVEKICDSLKAQRPEKILAISDFNAAVVTVPRRGLFGQRVYLLLGLPLMQAVTPGQLDAVLAHEIGHISERHSQTAASAYRLRQIWGQFLEMQQESGHKLAFLYDSFVRWFFPYFDAYSFVLCRRQEREADQYAVELVGARELGAALVNLDVKSRSLDQTFWKDVLDEAARDPAPPKQIFTRMAHAFRETNRAVEIKSLAQAVAVNTDYSDSHPSLAERLRTIGYWTENDLPPLPEPATETAAANYLGAVEAKLEAEFNQVWQERVKEDWKQRHEFMGESRQRLAEIDAKATDQELTADEMFEKAELIAVTESPQASLSILREIIARFPDHANAHFAVGAVLLDDDNDSGIEQIERAIELDRTLKLSGCERIFYYLKAKGRDEDAKRYILAIEAEQEILGYAQTERSGISPSDKFDRHLIDDERVAAIVGRIMYYDEIKAAYLVRKSVEYYSEVPLHVLFVEMSKGKAFGGGARLKPQELIETLANRTSEFGIDYFVVLDSAYATAKPQIASFDNAKIYEASTEAS